MSFWDYVKKAFNAKLPLKRLGPVPVNRWALFGAAIIGIAVHPVWLLAAAAEVLYLYSMATNPRFRKVVDGERLAGERQAWAGRVAALEAQLPRESRARFEKLLERCRSIQGLAGISGADVPTLEETKRTGMDQLAYMYLRLLASRSVIDAHFPSEDRPNLQREIERFERDLAAAKVSETVRRSKAGTLEIERKRLENLDRAAEQRAVIDSELERIEKQVELIREDTAMGREPGVLSSRIDQVVSALGETSDWMRKNADLIGEVGEEKPRDVPIFLERRASKEGE
jgi:hypothetical protein